MKPKAIIKKISSILHSWDPIGLTPNDEYDNLSLNLFKKIVGGSTKEELIDFVKGYLRNYIGLSQVQESDVNRVVSKILDEYNNYKSVNN